MENKDTTEALEQYVDLTFWRKTHMWYTCYYKQPAVRQYGLLSANEGQSECASCSSASFVSFSCSSCPSSSGSVTSSDSGNRKGDVATVDASIQKDNHQRELQQAVTSVRFYVNTAETYLSIFNNTTHNIHLGCSTPVCVCPSSGGSGGVFHSRSRCDSGSRLCSQDNHTPGKASVRRWATHRGPVQAH